MLKYTDLDQEQLAAIHFINEGEDALLCADVGTGKTVITLTAADNSIESGETTKWLVVAPLLVAVDTWAGEASEWEHLQHLRVSVACGTPKQRAKAFMTDADIYVTNYENLQWLMTEMYPKKRGKETLPFDAIVFDEIDKVRNVSTGRFKDVRNRVKHFKKRLGLTGTLLPRDLTDIWGQAYLVDNGETFGRSFYDWRKEYFYPIDFQQYKWTPFDDTRDEILRALDGLVFRVRGKYLPETKLCRPSMLDMPQHVFLQYKELEREFYLELKRGDQRHEVEAISSGVLSGKLREMCAGFSYVDGGKDAVWHSFCKFGWLDELYLRMKAKDEPLLVFYHFVEELAQLKKMFPGIANFGKGIKTAEKRRTIKQWNNRELDMLALHPQAAGHGLNLQKGGARHIAMLSLPWSGGMFRQAVGRLARRGQPHPTVYVHTPLMANTVDELVWRVVTDRLDTMDSFLDDLYDRQDAPQIGTLH